MPDESEEDLIPKVGILVAINPIGTTIFSPIGGYLSNKIGRKRPIMMASALAFIISSSGYSLISLANEELRYPLLIITRFISGCSIGWCYISDKKWFST